MVEKIVRIKNPTGLHLRPAGDFCNAAMHYQSAITFEHNGQVTNAKSVISVLAACVKCEDEILLRCEGEDEEEALLTLVGMVESGLGEGEVK